MSEIIYNYIRKNKPEVSDKTLDTYECILRNLYKKVFYDDYIKTRTYEINKFINEKGKIMDYLKNISFNKRKTVLSALVSITDDNTYRNQMLDDIKTYNEEHQKQKKESDDKTITSEELNSITEKFKKEALYLFRKKTLTKDEIQTIQDYILLRLYNGQDIAPRRSLDYTEMKIRNIDSENDNYIYKGKFIFNNYKTVKAYGQQSIEIPSNLKTLINKWLKINKSDYLLFDRNNNKLNNVQLAQRLNKIFNKNISVNGLRHHYLSNKYQSLIEIKNKLMNDMTNMGSSLIQETIYIKKI